MHTYEIKTIYVYLHSDGYSGVWSVWLPSRPLPLPEETHKQHSISLIA